MRGGITRHTFVAVLAGLAPTLCAADEGPAELSPIVVTATRSDQPAFDVPASIDLIDADELEQAAPGVNLSEVLRATPGVLVRDRQNYAQDLQVSIRGFGTRAPFGIVGTRLYVDGIPASMPDGAGQVSHFNLNSAERIEVLRGPFSVLYGNAAGGVIQIFTARGAETPRYGLESVIGSFGAARASLSASGVVSAFDYTADYTHFRTDGYRDHSRAERGSANLRLGWSPSPATQLRVYGNGVWIPDAQDPLGLTRAQFEADPRQAVNSATTFNTRKSVRQQQWGVALTQALGDRHSLDVSTYYGHRAVEQFLAIPPGAQGNPLHSGGVIDLQNAYYGAELRWTGNLQFIERPLELVAGLAYDLQDSHRRGYENFSGGEVGVRGALRRDEDNRIYDLDPYLQAYWDFAPRWALLAGVRYNTVRFESQDHYITAANPDDSGTLSFEATTPVAGLVFRAHEDLRLYASWGEGFDSPTFAELSYPPSGGSGLNTTLRPARTDSAELGLKWRQGSMRVNAALFEAETRDEIVVATAAGGRSSYQNAGRTRRQGMELSASTRLAPQLDARFAWTYVEAEFREAFLTCASRSCAAPDTLIPAGNRVPGVARAQLFTALQWKTASGWQAAVDACHLSSVTVNSTNSEAAPSHALLGADLGYRWPLPNLGVRAYLRVNNLLDRQHVGSVIINDSNGRYYEPGAERSVFAGVDLRFRP